MSREVLPCIRCDRELVAVDDTSTLPEEGTAFQTEGHYGSTTFDPMDGSFLEVNLCDPCIKQLAAKGRILHGRNRKPVVSYLDGPAKIPTFVGWTSAVREMVAWHPGLESEGAEDRLVVEPDEIGDPLFPEIQWLPIILEQVRKEDT